MQYPRCPEQCVVLVAALAARPDRIAVAEMPVGCVIVDLEGAAVVAEQHSPGGRIVLTAAGAGGVGGAVGAQQPWPGGGFVLPAAGAGGVAGGVVSGRGRRRAEEEGGPVLVTHGVAVSGVGADRAHLALEQGLQVIDYLDERVGAVAQAARVGHLERDDVATDGDGHLDHLARNQGLAVERPGVADDVVGRARSGVVVDRPAAIEHDLSGAARVG